MGGSRGCSWLTKGLLESLPRPRKGIQGLSRGFPGGSFSHDGDLEWGFLRYGIPRK